MIITCTTTVHAWVPARIGTADMTKIVSTDLTQLEPDPGYRASVDLPIEDFEFDAWTSRWVGSARPARAGTWQWR